MPFLYALGHEVSIIYILGPGSPSVGKLQKVEVLVVKVDDGELPIPSEGRSQASGRSIR